jgi:hypothetical protein
VIRALHGLSAADLLPARSLRHSHLPFLYSIDVTISSPFLPRGTPDITMPKDTTPLIRLPRQRPVSCRLCRLRKLRCSREAPCSNCRARGVSCELEPNTLPTAASEPELVERIRKLEQIVEQQQLQLLSNSDRSYSVESQQLQSIQFQNPSTDDNIVTDNVDADVLTNQQQVPTRNTFPEHEHLDKDIAWLESIYCGHDLSVHSSSSRLSTSYG